MNRLDWVELSGLVAILRGIGGEFSTPLFRRWSQYVVQGWEAFKANAGICTYRICPSSFEPRNAIHRVAGPAIKANHYQGGVTSEERYLPAEHEHDGRCDGERAAEDG